LSSGFSAVTVRQLIFNGLIALTVAALPAQCLINPSAVNVACTCIVLSSSLMVLFYLKWSSALEFHPLSSAAILGLCICSQLGALLVQTAYLTALVDSLYDPLYTFAMLALFQAIAVFMHAVYGFFSVKRPTVGDRRLIRGLLDWAGVYRTPTCGMLWYMGFMGLPTFVFAHYEGVASKIAAGFTFLAWAPFLIPFYRSEIGESYCNAKLNRILLAGYVALVALLGVALNARGIVFAGVATVALLYLIAGMRSHAPVTRRALLMFAGAGALLLAVSGPVSDLATSMQIARQARAKLPPQEMIRETVRIWGQPRLIAAYRADQAAASRFTAYDEHYIDNAMLSRLIETKFYDNSFHFAKTLSSDSARARLRDISVQLAWAELPTPLLKRLGISIDKDSLQNSMGDYLAYLSRGVPLGGHKTGEMFAQGMALFGPLFPCLYALACLALFALMDLLTIRSAEGAASISGLGMLQIWTFFQGGLTYESLHKLLGVFVRNFEQMVLIYSMILAPAWLLVRKSPNAPALPDLSVWQRSP
jgi:hypothetical protein